MFNQRPESFPQNLKIDQRFDIKQITEKTIQFRFHVT